ncbi:hypothetical protein, partial [Listeria monocytogenes]
AYIAYAKMKEYDFEIQLNNH